jgi:hypothetical protein
MIIDDPFIRRRLEQELFKEVQDLKMVVEAKNKASYPASDIHGWLRQ